MPRPGVLETLAGPVPLDRTRIMGIVNVTPDSFYDGGRHATLEAACARAVELERQGADLIDIGGESTRPGSQRLLPEQEIERVVPVVAEVAKLVKVPVSVDTYRAEVARRAIEAGAAMVNDVTALRGDPEMVRVVASTGAPVVLMHALWPPATMQDSPEYVDVVEDVAAFLEERARLAMALGVKRDRILVDPGIGFGKSLEHNLVLLREMPRLVACGYPVLVGPSRKSFIGQLVGRGPDGRLWGTAGAAAMCAAMGAAVVRVHDAAEILDVVRVVDAIVWQV